MFGRRRQDRMAVIARPVRPESPSCSIGPAVSGALLAASVETSRSRDLPGAIRSLKIETACMSIRQFE